MEVFSSSWIDGKMVNIFIINENKKKNYSNQNSQNDSRRRFFFIVVTFQEKIRIDV